MSQGVLPNGVPWWGYVGNDTKAWKGQLRLGRSGNKVLELHFGRWQTPRPGLTYKAYKAFVVYYDPKHRFMPTTDEVTDTTLLAVLDRLLDDDEFDPNVVSAAFEALSDVDHRTFSLMED